MTDWTNTSQVSAGTDVYGSDGHKVGSVVAVQGNYIVVEKGFFFPTDYYIPGNAINAVDNDGIYLNVTKDAALHSGWDAVPLDYESEVVAGMVETDTQYDDTLITGTGVGTATTATTGRIEGEDRIAIPVHEEELIAGRRSAEVGHVRVEKVVTSEERTIDVPVTEERVRVERHAVDRPVSAAEGDVFTEEVIDIPVHGEDVIAEKRVRVAEEVEIAKEQVQRTERVSGTVRREDVRITDDVPGGSAAATGDESGVIDTSR
jgi:uncharacterized protein (TIGR02271 family)